MTDFLLELRSEEIPARMQAKAREDLARLFTAELAAAGIAAPTITTYATPRRLALIARDLPNETAAVSEETKGPKTSAPPQALEGFLRKTGLTRDQLVEHDGVLFAVIDKPGRATADVLAEAIPRIVRAFPWPKSMRWGAASLSTESLRWVRPLQGIIALLDSVPVDLEVSGIVSGRETVGHRFHSTGAISIDSAASYVDQLRAAHVIVDQDERAAIIRTRAAALASEAGLKLIEDEGLVAENAGLTEWPVPLLGRFDAAFLSVPPEVIQLTARVNQKYFVCSSPLPLAGGAGGGPELIAADSSVDTPTPNPSRKREGSLANAFICTANIDAADGGVKIIEGNRKVLAARLSDAKFFYDTDLKVPLEEQAAKLNRIVFHEKLGTVADKVDRVAKLARWLCEEGIVTSPSPLRGEGRGEGGEGEARAPATSVGHPHPTSAGSTVPRTVEDRPGNDPTLRSLEGEGLAREELAHLAERAARLCKADLVTGMVGEFPELQGVMGGYYALAQGEDPRVAAAIRDHYKPVGQGDEVPTDPVTVAVSLADKLDTIASFFAIGEQPTGSKDPFALRRAALSVLALAANLGRLPAIRLVVVATNYSLAKQYMARIRAEDKSFDRIMGDFWPEFPEGVEKTREYTGRFKDQFPDLYHIFLERVVPALAEVQALFLKTVKPTTASLSSFMIDRLKVQQREAGVRHDLIDAVFALGGEDDLVRLLARVRALQAFIGTEDGANLLAGYKRAANILKKEAPSTTTPVTPANVPGSTVPQEKAAGGAPWAPEQVRGDDAGGAGVLPYAPEPAEAALIAALDVAEPAAAAAVAAEDFEGAMAALATLRAPIDAFFEGVIVNDPDPDKRAARLALLGRVRDAVHMVADFSKIEG